ATWCTPGRRPATGLLGGRRAPTPCSWAEAEGRAVTDRRRTRREGRKMRTIRDDAGIDVRTRGVRRVARRRAGQALVALVAVGIALHAYATGEIATIQRVAGTGAPAGSGGDGGPATSAGVLNPTGLVFDGANDAYVATADGLR